MFYPEQYILLGEYVTLWRRSLQWAIFLSPKLNAFSLKYYGNVANFCSRKNSSLINYKVQIVFFFFSKQYADKL